MRLARETLDERKPQPAQSAGFQTIKRALAAAAPLIAGLMVGCSDVALPNDCRIYNETTITLNRETDGRSVDLRSLESIPPGSFLTAHHIDFINEAHAIADEGIPADTRATQSPSYCLMGGDNGGQRLAYAQQSDLDGAQRGLYVPENQSLGSVTLINLVSHEIGHLQPGNPENGSEIMSQLNEYGQKLAGFALLMMQGVDDGQLVRWASYESQSGIYHRLARTLESGRGQSGNDPLDAYDKANMLLFTRLGETGGDIPAIRAEFRQLVESGGLEAALDEASTSFLALYSTANLPDLFIDARIRLISAMQGQFGAADSYFQAHSQLLDSGLVFGLEGMNCALTAPIVSAEYAPCSDDVCAGIGADSSRPISVSLCCVGAVVQASVIEFSKWNVEASGTKYRNENGMISVDQFEWGSAMYLSATKTAMGIDEPCG